MITEVVMERELWGQVISQKSKSSLFSGTDLARAGNMWRLSNGLAAFNMPAWLRQKGTLEFIKEIEMRYPDTKIKVVGRGRNAHTWLHPLLFIDMALAISPKLKIQCYEWLYDRLLQYRNDSGDSYKAMSGCLYSRYPNKREFPAHIEQVAVKIKRACSVRDWESANQDQLKLRDKIHDSIILLSDVMTDSDQIVRLGIQNALKRFSLPTHGQSDVISREMVE
jgi:hypothetical protein